MLNDWKTLTPHRPLEAGDPLYALRPEGSGDELAALVQHGFSPIAVAGPMGSGKSTELAAAAQRLQPWGIACEIHLDRSLDMRHVEEDAVYDEIIKALDKATASKYPGVESAETARARVRIASPTRYARSSKHEDIVAELREHAKLAPVALLIDGLEKSTEETCRRIVNALLELGDCASLVIVVPPSMVTGPSSYDLLSRAQKIFSIGPICTEELTKKSEAGIDFLEEVAMRRLGCTDEPSPALHDLIAGATLMSGGLIRVFLQLLRDAKRYASLAGREMPTKEDLDDAAKDHAEHLERLLGPGDLAALRAADGTSGSEIQPIDRRLRFLVHGLLLEYKIGARTIVQPAPLLGKLLAQRSAA